MSLNGQKSRLASLTKSFSLRWASTQSHWRDVRSAEFDHRFLQDLPPRVNQATQAIEKLDELLNKIRKECE
jgi:hypothetical protein